MPCTLCYCRKGSKCMTHKFSNITSMHWVFVWNKSIFIYYFIYSTLPPKTNFNTFFSAYYPLKVHLHHFSKIKSQKESQNSKNQGFSYYFCMMIEGSGSGSMRTKNIWIRNTSFHNTAARVRRCASCWTAWTMRAAAPTRRESSSQSFTWRPWWPCSVLPSTTGSPTVCSASSKARIALYQHNWLVTSVADPDPGSGASLTSESGICFVPDPKPTFLRAYCQSSLSFVAVFGSEIRDGKKSGSGIRDKHPRIRNTAHQKMFQSSLRNELVETMYQQTPIVRHTCCGKQRCTPKYIMSAVSQNFWRYV